MFAVLFEFQKFLCSGPGFNLNRVFIAFNAHFVVSLNVWENVSAV